VNFLLHHHFASRELAGREDAAACALGAMLPDFFRMALGGRRRDRGALPSASSLSPTAVALQIGAAHHASIDRWFHACAVFTEGERELKRAWLLPGSPKLVLFAHAAWEMCLDGALEREWAGDVPRDFSDAGEATSDVLALADAEGITTALDAPTKAMFETRIRRILSALADGTLYADYRQADGIVQRITGMRAAFGLPFADEGTRARWSEALEPLMLRAGPSLDELRAARGAMHLTSSTTVA
jgi:hypothetical protein